MEVHISIFDPATHTYDYLAGMVVTHEEANRPMWVSVEVIPPLPGWPRSTTLVSYPFRAADEAAAQAHAECRRGHRDAVITVRLHRPY